MAYKQDQDNGLQELKTALRDRNPGRLYFFHGEEVFLLHHYLDQLKKKTVDELTESFNFHKLNSETFELQTFADRLEKACLDTLNAGIMTKDLVNLVDDTVTPTPVNSREFLAAIRSRLEEA